MGYMPKMLYNPKRKFRSMSEYIEFYFRFRNKVLRGDIPVSREISNQMNNFDRILIELDSAASS